MPVPEQQRVIETMKRLRSKGLALRAIADKVTAAGKPDQPWSGSRRPWVPPKVCSSGHEAKKARGLVAQLRAAVQGE